MEISNDTSQGVDYLYYFTTQLPQDLARLAALREELQVRQGAMSAVEDATRMRDETARILASAKEEADALKADTKAKNADATAKKKAQDVREDELIQRENEFAAVCGRRETELSVRKTQADRAEEIIASRQSVLDAREAQLANDVAALDARVKAFQDKVAALSA